MTPVQAQTPLPTTLGPPPTVTLDYGAFSGGPRHVAADQVHLDYGGELTLDAPHLEGDPAQQTYDAAGGVRAHSHDTTLTADHLHFEGRNHIAQAEGTLLTRRPFTVRAQQIEFQPTGLTATQANVTTAKPGDKPDIELRVGQMSVTPMGKATRLQAAPEHIVLNNVALYLLHNHIVTIRRLATTLSGKANGAARRQPPHPTFGYSGLYGPFLGYNNAWKVGSAPLRYSLIVPLRGTPQIRVTSTQTLLVGPAVRPETPLPPPPPVRPHDYLATIRALTTVPPPILPDGDPLRFHDFLPDPNPIRLFDQPQRTNVSLSEEVSYHIQSEGNGRNDLFVSRYPEVTLSGVLPLTTAYALPAPGDAAAFRRYLRHVTLYAGVEADVGRFHEQPTNIDATRQRYTFRLFTRPLLVGASTVILPTYTVLTNRYSGASRTYDYSQYSLAVNHYFSQYAAVGVQYVASDQQGSSPFNFDVLDTSQELDARIQGGNARLSIAGDVRYDVIQSHVIDYTLAIAPALHGFTPVFSYRFFSRAIGVGFEIPGLTF